MIDTKCYYVYEWFIVETGEIFHVGKGSNNRITSMKNRNALFKKIKNENKCDCRIVKYFNNEKDAFDFEHDYGVSLKKSGQAYSNFMLGGKGRYTEPEVFDKMKDTWFKKGTKPWNKGKKMDSEFKIKCSISHLGKKQTDETKKKRSEALIGHEVSIEARKKIGKSKSKPIICTNIESGIITRYSSATELANIYGVSLSIISLKIKNKKPYKGNYIEFEKQANPEGI